MNKATPRRGARPVEPIRWKKDALEVLDQRLLPHREVYLTCRSAADVAKAIKDMALRGAPLIGCAAAYGMALAARDGAKGLKKAAESLRASRPTAVALFKAVDRALAAARDAEYKSLPVRAEVEAEADRLFDEDLEASRGMAQHGAGELRGQGAVITICNTGALATAGLGTAFSVIREGFKRGLITEVLACETRPYLQGARLTLWELQREGIPAALITDGMAAAVMRAERPIAALAGADRIASNGDTANKIGTYGLAVLARHHGIPFYIVAPSDTVDRSLASGDAIPIEQRSADEVLTLAGQRIAPKGARARHPAFDVTPADLITGIITEQGAFRAPYDF